MKSRKTIFMLIANDVDLLFHIFQFILFYSPPRMSVSVCVCAINEKKEYNDQRSSVQTIIKINYYEP